MPEESEGEGLKTVRLTRFLGSLTEGDETRSVGDSEIVAGDLGEDDDGQGLLLITERALGVGVCGGLGDLMLRESVVEDETGSRVDR